MRSAWKIVLIYILVSAVWILLTDNAISLMTNNVEILTILASIKGMLFIAVTAMLLFILVQNEIRVKNKIISQLEITLRQREELIKELHHRVKNNLQVISSVLSLEKGKISQCNEMVDKLLDRILSMGAVHNVVYKKETMKNLILEEVIKEYSNVINAEEYKFEIVSEVDESRTYSMEELVSLFLLINEILEYVSSVTKSEKLSIVIKNQDTSIILQISTSRNLINAQNILDELFIKAFLDTLKAELEIEQNDFNIFCRITFKH